MLQLVISSFRELFTSFSHVFHVQLILCYFGSITFRLIDFHIQIILFYSCHQYFHLFTFMVTCLIHIPNNYAATCSPDGIGAILLSFKTCGNKMLERGLGLYIKSVNKKPVLMNLWKPFE